ncbi:hypothetical protein [Serratia ureilytica]|uniref:Uncharacterized protein n=1 Tax=Serratia ureilytica TaxID=300181 RepID=A0A9X9G0W8_9GAMM|nr:hypothetical protein [Serratia ureilytica]TXE25871.1 hypothetical protein FOT63_21915 [Serratia ureilytica]
MSILDVNTNAIFSALGGASPLSIINSVLHPSYSIRKTGSATVALEFSGMASIQPSGSAAITTAPIEQGKYQSINKVMRPGRVIAEIVIDGLTGFSGAVPNIFDLTLVSQSDTLTTIRNMLGSTELYDIDTPKDTYTGYDLIDYAYSVSSTRGVTMLVVHLVFQEVIQMMGVTLNSEVSGTCLITDEYSSSPTGTSSKQTTGGTQASTLDNLSQTWGRLKDDIGEATDAVSSGFTSAMDTVNKTLNEVGSSAVDKSKELVASISKAVT